MENALVTDGCDLTDTGSTLSAVGGSGGSVYTVQITLTHTTQEQSMLTKETPSGGELMNTSTTVVQPLLTMSHLTTQMLEVHHFGHPVVH